MGQIGFAFSWMATGRAVDSRLATRLDRESAVMTRAQLCQLASRMRVRPVDYMT